MPVPDSRNMYQRIGCCLLAAAEHALIDNDLPLPERRDISLFGVAGDPSCCDALLVSLLPTVPVGGAVANRQAPCGPVARRLTWEVKLIRPVCQNPPECSDEGLTVCSPELLGCPGEPYLFEDDIDPCSEDGYAYQQALILNDAEVLDTAVLNNWMGCLCQHGGWPESCEVDCPGMLGCVQAQYLGSQLFSGGGCAGVRAKYSMDVTGRH